MMDPISILVVDDNQTICQVLKEALGDEGYRVMAVNRGEDGLLELRRHSYPIVLLDLMLPGMHGSRILHEIKRKFPKTDVIIMTSHASVDTAVEALRLGAQDYLIKPFENLEMVTRVIQKTIQKTQLLEENGRLVEELKAKTHELESAVQRLSSLNEMSQALHSILDLKELLHFFVTLVASELAAERVSLMLSNRKTGEMMIEAAIGLDEQLARTVRVRVGEGIAGRVVQEGKPLLVENIEKDSRFQKQVDRSYNTDSFLSAPLVLSVPIKLKQEVLGVINVNNKQKGGVFTQRDLEFVAILASQAALAIENVRIFEELKAVNRELNETPFEPGGG